MKIYNNIIKNIDEINLNIVSDSNSSICYARFFILIHDLLVGSFNLIFLVCSHDCLSLSQIFLVQLY